MPRTFSLATVRALRKQKEEVEERGLTAANAQLAHVLANLERIENEIKQMATARVHEVQTVHAAAHHQATQARYKLLCDARMALHSQLEHAEARRNEQRLQYLAARTGREMLTELKQQQAAAWDAEVSRREGKRLDDLFHARRARH